jgi:hypothetical protein
MSRTALNSTGAITFAVIIMRERLASNLARDEQNVAGKTAGKKKAGEDDYFYTSEKKKQMPLNVKPRKATLDEKKEERQREKQPEGTDKAEQRIERLREAANTIGKVISVGIFGGVAAMPVLFFAAPDLMLPTGVGVILGGLGLFLVMEGLDMAANIMERRQMRKEARAKAAGEEGN